MQKYDYLIVGAGLFGAVAAHRLKLAGKKSLVIDKRKQVGGNLFCENIAGINVHKYGAHIFHTSNAKIWQFVNSLVDFNRYTNSPVANYHGRLFNLPFNMNTFYQMWGVHTPEEAQLKINGQREIALAKMKADGVNEARNLEEQAQLLIGKDIYEALIKGYTEKQWGRKCNELPAFIINRLPVRFVFDNNYFNDKYQGIPIGGYNPLIAKLLQDVDIITDTDFFDNREKWKSQADKIIFTGSIDRFYDYCFGHLEYRTLRFETEKVEKSNYQGCAVVNYTDSETPYTRIIEHKHFESFGDEAEKIQQTIITKEYSSEWKEGCEPFYPVNDAKNSALYQQYLTLSKKESRVIFGGRLAEYKYYDMDKIIERAESFQI